ncbi:MAG: CaiB/BaiF CoA-transferase family protein, partial [Myxococcota bacterium]
IDLALFDSTLAWLANVATNHFVSGHAPKRYGNAHPNIVPYQTFPTADGWVVIACGNDSQFRRLCLALGCEEIAADARYRTNEARLAHRDELVELLEERTRRESTAHWVSVLEQAKVSGGPVHDVPTAFADPQAVARGMRRTMSHPDAGSVDVIANPIRMSETPIRYARVPPKRGEHADEILKEWGFDAGRIDELRRNDVIE